LAAVLLALLPMSCSSPVASTWDDVTVRVPADGDLLALIDTEQATRLTGTDNVAVSAVKALAGAEANRVMVFKISDGPAIVTVPIVNVEKYDSVTENWHDTQIGDDDARAIVSGNSVVISDQRQLWVTLNVNKVDDAVESITRAHKAAVERSLASDKSLCEMLFDAKNSDIGVAIVKNDDTRYIANLSGGNDVIDITIHAVDNNLKETVLSDRLTPFAVTTPGDDVQCCLSLGLERGELPRLINKYVSPRLSLIDRAKVSYAIGAFADIIAPLTVKVTAEEPREITVSYTSPDARRSVRNVKAIFDKGHVDMNVAVVGDNTVVISGEAPSLPFIGTAPRVEAPDSATVLFSGRIERHALSSLIGDMDSDMDVTIVADRRTVRARLERAR
jgi:hypothetical protein